MTKLEYQIEDLSNLVASRLEQEFSAQKVMAAFEVWSAPDSDVQSATVRVLNVPADLLNTVERRGYEIAASLLPPNTDLPFAIATYPSTDSQYGGFFFDLAKSELMRRSSYVVDSLSEGIHTVVVYVDGDPSPQGPETPPNPPSSNTHYSLAA